MNNEIYGRLEIIIENERGRKKSAGWKQTIRRVSGEAKFSLVRLNKPLDRVSLVQTLTTKDCKGPQTNMPKNVGFTGSVNEGC